MDVNVTTPLPPSLDSPVYPQYVGYICCGLAALLLGSNFAVVKKFETGNGIFFNWMVCNGIIVSGYVVHIIRQSEVHSFVMVGGAIWTTASMCIVPIVKAIGLGVGLCIWASVMLVVGWGNARFGLLGVDIEIPSHVTMNYIGVCLSLTSAILYSFVRPDLTPIEPEVDKTNCAEDVFTLPEVSNSRNNTFNEKPVDNKNAEAPRPKVKNQDLGSIIEAWSPLKKKLFGVVLSVFSGALYAIMFIPATYVQEHYEGATLDYVFSHYCGIHLTSTFYVTLYVCYTRNLPIVYPRVIVPGMVSGVMWGTGMALWFVANGTLSEAVAFPIVSTLPQAISLLLSILIFKEIKGARNIGLVGVAMMFTLSGAVVAGLSK